MATAPLGGAMSGLSYKPKSRAKHPKVYLTIELDAKFAIYLKEMLHPAWARDMEAIGLWLLREGIIKRFGPLGDATGKRVSAMTDRDALLELIEAAERRQA